MDKQTNDFGSFKWLTGDTNFVTYGGKWIRRVGARRYHVIELLNWEETVGSREAAEVGATYNVSLSEVDVGLIAMTPPGTAPALNSCGFRLQPNGDSETDACQIVSYDGDVVARGEHDVELVLVEACHGAGSRAPLWDENGSNYLKLLRSARAVSRQLDAPDLHTEAMDRPVNQIGTSARNYMLGKLFTGE